MKAYADVVGSRVPPTVLRFAADGGRASYRLTDAFCEDPLCPGFEQRITLTEVGNDAHAISFEVDAGLPEIRWGKPAPPEDEAIANELVRSRASLRLFERRRQLVRAFGLSLWDGPTVASQDGCYSFTDFTFKREAFFLPFAAGVPDEPDWLALDQYCVNPSCSCDEALLTFYRNVKSHRPAPPAGDLALDLASGEARALTGGPLESGVAARLEALKAEVGDLRLELGLRRTLLRVTARRRLHAPVRVAGRGVEPGRNERCPCGSGRKFKKCCGAT